MKESLLKAALYYADLGYLVFPCAPGGKAPVTSRGFKDATTDAARIEAWWKRHPNANIGMATAGLVVVDIDGPDNPWLEDEPDRAMELASGPLSLTPGGGRHHIFRQPAGKSWGNTVGKLAPKVDTRAGGGYIVVPPSIVDWKSYAWAEGYELDRPRESLPEPPPWLVDMLDGGRDLFSLPSRSAETPRDAPAPATQEPPRPADGNSIPRGQRNDALARLAGAMRRVGMTVDEILAALTVANRDRCRPPLPDDEVAKVTASIARYEPDQVAVAVAENHYNQDRAEDTAPEEKPTIQDPGPLPEGLLRVPGFIEKVIDYTLSTAPFPQRTLAFCGALALQATLSGRKVRDPGGARTNLYLLGLANSGTGKDHPRKVNQRVLLAAGLADNVGDDFASGEGIEDRVLASNTVLFQTDEIDAMVLTVSKSRDGRAERIMEILLKFYSSADGVYHMRVKAGQEPCAIDQPCLVLLGSAIPKHYYESLSEKMLTNGFFARMLVFEAGNRGPGQEPSERPLPADIAAIARYWADLRSGPGNMSLEHPEPREVPFGDGVEDVWRRIRGEETAAYDAAQDADDPIAMAIWARAAEKARRLSLIYACSEDHRSPVISCRAVEWGWAVVTHQTQRMLFMASEHVYENEFHAKCKKLVATLRRWRQSKGQSWMPFWRINRKLPWPERDHEEVRSALLNQRQIDYEEHRTGGRPQRRYRLRGAS